MDSPLPPEIRWLIRQVRPLFLLHLVSFVCITTASLIGLLNPLILKWLIDQVLPSRQLRLLAAPVALLFLTYVGRTALMSLGAYIMLQAAQKMALDLRRRVLRHLDSLSADYHENTPIGTSIYPLKEPIEEIATFGSELVPSLLRTVVAVAVTFAAMVALNAGTTLAILPLVPLFLAARTFFRRRIQEASEAVQSDRLGWSSFLQEHVAAAVPIQLLRRELYQERRAFLLLASMVRSQQRLFRTGVMFTMSTNAAVGLGVSAVMGYGGWCVVTGSLTVGGLVAFYGYLLQIFDPLSGAAETYARVQKTFGSIRQVQTILALRPALRSSPHLAPFPAASWDIVASAVHFSYPTGSGVSIPQLHIPSGELVAIAGANGAGKSTLAKLLVRLYDPDSGAISIGGTDLSQIRLDCLRRRVCLLPQYPALFHGSLALNLRVAKPSASLAELEQVMEHVGLMDWLRQLPQGWEHSVGPGGSHLSAGQRQRVGIARAILQRPCVLVSDEAASCLDTSSEQLLLRDLRCLLPGTTLILISHRLSTILCAKRILLFEAGRIAGDGSPADLFASNDVYRRLFRPNSAVPASASSSCS